MPPIPRYLAIVLVLVSASTETTALHSRLFDARLLLHSLSLSRLPDHTKMNVSQDEYETKFQEYEKRLKESKYAEDVTSFHSVRHSDLSRRIYMDFNWSKNATKDISLSLGSKIRVFVDGNDKAELEISKSDRLVELRSLNDLPRWLDVDGGVEWWRYKLKCRNCYLSQAAVVVHNKQTNRKKRHSDFVGRTDCKMGRKKRTCCRHEMPVIFKDLPGYEFVQQPFGFDAGYCKGSCPYRHNHATHHASIQILIRKLNKEYAPKLCCAPSKLEPLQLIHLDEHDHSKLKVSTWTDMKVIECACF